MTELVVNGNTVEFDMDELLSVTDISADMDSVAAQLGYWGVLWAQAEGERELADAFYRQWRAKMGKIALGKEPKMAEWKIKQLIEAAPKFLEVKKKLSESIHNATMCKMICDALRVKSNMLQSKGAMMRHELDSTGMNTKASDGARKKAMRNALRKKQ